jgi:hypothetical protein
MEELMEGLQVPATEIEGKADVNAYGFPFHGLSLIILFCYFHTWCMLEIIRYYGER